MGNQPITENKIQSAKIISNKEHSHLAFITQLQYQTKMCYRKIYTFADAFLMEETLRRFKTRINKLSNNRHILNIYHLQKLENKDLCASNYKLYAYLQYYDQSLKEMMQNKVTSKKNFTEEEIYDFIKKVIESLIYIQDNGLKNLQLDSQSILFGAEGTVKVLDNGIAYSNSYFKFLNNLQNNIHSEEIANSLYLAPQVVKDLKQFNYDPYISLKADIFSLGMLVLEMICLESLSCYYNYNSCEIDYDSLIHRISKINYSLNLKTLLAEMLEYDPEERIGLASLQEKISKLKDEKKEVVNRSKSSKMLKEILSQSRRSSSINKNLSECPSQRRLYKVQLSSESSRRDTQQPSKQTSKQTSARKQASSTYLSKKQNLEYQTHLQPSFQPHQLKNLVKNKLAKENNKQNILLKDDHFRSKTMVEQMNVNATKTLLDKNMNKFESSLNAHKNIFECSQQSSSLGKLVEASGIKNVLKMQHLDNKMKVSNKYSNDSSNGKITSRFANIDSHSMVINLKQKQNLRKVVKTERDQPNPSFLDIETRQKEKMLKTLGENSQPFTARNNFAEKQLMKVMTFNNKEFANGKIMDLQRQESNGKIERLIYSPIHSQRFEEVFDDEESEDKLNEESPAMKIDIHNMPVMISQGKSSQKDYDTTNQRKMNKSIQNKLFNMTQYVHSIEQETPISNSKLVCEENKIEEFQTYHSKQQDDNWLFKKIKGKKPNLNLNIDSAYDSYKTVNKFNRNFNSISAKDRQICEDVVQNQTKFDGMYKTSKSIEQISQFTSIDGQHRDSKNDTINNLFAPFDDGQSQSKMKGSIFNKIKLPNGDIYEGQLSIDNKFQGNGILYNSQNQIIYSGSWKAGLRHGFGTYHNKKFVCLQVDYTNLDLKKNNWVKYEGEFENGYQNGFGTIYYSEGQKFSGCLKNDQVQGYGCFYKRSGELVSGLWNENKFKKF